MFRSTSWTKTKTKQKHGTDIPFENLTRLYCIVIHYFIFGSAPWKTDLPLLHGDTFIHSFLVPFKTCCPCSPATGAYSWKKCVPCVLNMSPYLLMRFSFTYLGWFQGVRVTKYFKNQQTCMILNSSTDPADPADQVSSTAAWDLPSTRTGDQDDVSSKQTPSNYRTMEV